MKTCPVCGFRMEDAASRCTSCGADYADAIVASITSGLESDTDSQLANLEEGLQPLEGVPTPTMGETLGKLLPDLCGATALFCAAALLLTGANLFILPGAAALVALLSLLIPRMRGRRPVSRGERIVRAVRCIFAEDVAAVRSRIGEAPDAEARIERMQRRIDQAGERVAEAHARNRKKILTAALIIGAVACIGCGWLAVRNHAARKAAAEYALQPEWVKLRDSYLASPDNDEYGSPEAREQVLRAMLDARETAQAETFFFAHCQGKVGDAACARLIALRYREAGEKEALDAFVDRLSLRYDSDTRKLRALKR